MINYWDYGYIKLLYGNLSCSAINWTLAMGGIKDSSQVGLTPKSKVPRWTYIITQIVNWWTHDIKPWYINLSSILF